MKIKKIVPSLILLTAIVSPFLTLAQDPPEAPIETVGELTDVLTSIVTTVRTIFFILAILFLVLAAFKYLTAQGDEEKIKGAKNMFIYSIVAIAIALIATGITALIGNIIAPTAP